MIDEDKREIRFLGDLQRLSPQPGDMFVITTEQRISQEQRHAIVATWASAMPGHKVLVLDGGLKIGVIDAIEPPNASNEGPALATVPLD